MKTYRRLLCFLKPYLFPHFIGAMASMVLFSATTGYLPYLVKDIFNGIFANKDVRMLFVVPVAIFAIFVVRSFFSFSKTYLTDYVGQRVIADLRSKVNSHLHTLSLSFFQRHPSGILVSRVTNDVAIVRTALTDALGSLLGDSVSFVVLMAVAFLQDWVLALIAFVVFPLAGFPIIRLSRRMRKVSRKGQSTMGALAFLLQETIQGNRVVKAFGMEEYEKEKFQKENQTLFKLYMKASRIRALTGPSMEILAAIAIAGVVWYGGRSVIFGGRTQGEFMAFLTALFLIREPFQSLSKTNSSIQQGIAAAERVFEILDAVPEIKDKPAALPVREFSNRITFEDVSFSYGDQVVLRDINLVIERGEVVAIVGMSGGGKSTLVDLIPRFYDVTKGKITLDGVDLRDLSVKALRSLIAVVTQHTFLFNDTIRNNIAYGEQDREIGEVVAVARAANAHDFIMRLPHGYNTVIGEMGFTLSGGERQRLAIARALMKDAPILILDEATSSLDAESERLVQKALDSLMVNRTTVVIAHRLSTIRRADRIIVIADGRIVEEGKHEDLMGRSREYCRLYQMQDAESDAAQSMVH